MDLIAKRTRNGKGIVAMRDFAAGETLYEVTGPFVTCDEDEDMDETERSNTFRFSRDLYISPKGTIGNFQNHSCEPNAKVVKRGKRIFVAAAKQVRKGEEVLIDYSTIVASDDVWEMRCNCGAVSCRKIVGSFDALPASLRRKYMRSGIVPRYIIALSA